MKETDPESEKISCLRRKLKNMAEENPLHANDVLNISRKLDKYIVKMMK